MADADTISNQHQDRPLPLPSHPQLAVIAEPSPQFESHLIMIPLHYSALISIKILN